MRRRETLVGDRKIQVTFGVTLGNGNVFSGEVKGNLPIGNGTYTKANGDKFTGYFEDGKMSGYFMVDYSNGDVYRGDLDDNGIREGKGVYNYADGRKYEGEWRGDIKHGQGVFTLPDVARYEGEWRDDNRAGQGIYYFADGRKYEGEWRDNKKNGWGRFIFKNDQELAEYDGEWIDDDITGYGKMVFKDKKIYNGHWNSDKGEGQGLLFWPNGTCFYGQMKNGEMYHGITMTKDLVFTYPQYKNATYDQKGFKVVNFTAAEIECFQEEKDISCYNKPNEVETIYLGGFEHYYTGDTITIRKRKIRDGFGEYGVDGGYYIGEWKQGIQTGFGLKTEPFLLTIIGTFENGILEGLGASISYSSKHRFIYVGGYLKGQPFGPGMFIYPDGGKVLGYFIEGKLDHTANPIYLHPDGTRDSLVPTSG